MRRTPLENITGRLHIFVHWDKADQANREADHWDPYGGGAETFGLLRMSATGLEPPSHTACSTVVNGDVAGMIQTAARQVPFVEVFDASEYTFDEAAAAVGVKAIREEPLP